MPHSCGGGGGGGSGGGGGGGSGGGAHHALSGIPEQFSPSLLQGFGRNPYSGIFLFKQVVRNSAEPRVPLPNSGVLT